MTVNYKLEFHILMDFVAELEDTNSDLYRWHNETIGELASGAINCSTPDR